MNMNGHLSKRAGVVSLIPIILLLIYSLMMPSSLYANPFTVDLTGEETGYPGSLSFMQDYRHNVTLGDLQLGAPVFLENAWEGGTRLGVGGFNLVYESSDTLIAEAHGPASLGLESLRIRQTWIQAYSELHYQLSLIAEDTIHIRNDLHVKLNVPNYDMHTWLNACQEVDTAHSTDFREIRSGMQNGVIAYRGNARLVMMMDNPMFGDIYWDDTTGLEWCILRTRNSVSAIPETTLVHSVLIPGQVIERGMRLTCTSNNYSTSSLGSDIYFSPSAQMGDATGSILMVGDDIPYEKSSHPWTTSDNQLEDPYGSLMVRFFEEHPDVVMTSAMCIDGSGLWLDTDTSDSKGWFTDRGCFAYVPYDKYSGERSLRFEVLHGEDIHVWQRVTASSDAPMTVSAKLYIPDAFDAGEGFRIQVTPEDSSEYWNSDIIESTSGWQTVTYTTPVGMTTGETYRVKFIVFKKPWDLEPVTDPVLHQQTNSVFLDDVMIDFDGAAVSIRNPGFEEGTMLFYFDSPGYEFWNSHGYRRYSDFSDEIHEWFRRLDHGDPLYEWEKQLRLIVHCYHHVTNKEYIRPNYVTVYGQEFCANVEEWQLAAYDALDRDFELMGLDNVQLAMRPSGLSFHQFTIQEALRRGYRWMDGYHSYNNHYSFYPVYGDSTYLWMHGLMFWGDDLGSGWGRLWMTQHVLMVGGTSLWGLHPATAFGYWTHNPSKYDEFSSYIQQISDEYPHMVWESPFEIIERSDVLDQWTDLATYVYDDVVQFRWNGPAKEGMSLIAFHPGMNYPSLQATLMGVGNLEVVTRRTMSYIILPELEKAEHILTISQDLSYKTGLPSSPHFRVWPVPSNSSVRVSWFNLSLQGKVTVNMYDLLGRRVMTQNLGYVSRSIKTVVPTDGLSSGIYFLQMTSSGMVPIQETRKIVLIK